MSVDEKDGFVYDLLKGSHDGEIERRKELDGKASNLMGYVTIITGLTIGLGTASFRDTLTQSQFYVTYFIGIGFLLGSVITALIASRVMTWNVVPIIENLEDENSNDAFTKLTMINQRICELLKSVKVNHCNNESKAKWIMYSWYFLVAGLITLVVFLFILVTTPIT